MISFTISPLSTMVCAVAMVASVTSSPASPTDEPTPTPTPRPGTLAAYASRTSLDRKAVDGETGQVTITSENLAELAEGGAMTIGPPAEGPPVPIGLRGGADPGVRTRWRARYMRQRRVITKIEGRRTKVEAEIDRIKRGSLSARNLARLDRAREKLQLLDGEIRRERVELGRIVREARRHGAQPGWFR